MSIQLKLTHEEGVRLRQQTAQKVERGSAGQIQAASEWKFDKHQDQNGHATEECPQDLDPRRVGNDGKKIPLGTYTLHVTYNMRNLVVERKGKISPFNFKNPAIRNQMRVRYQELKPTDRKKDGKVIHEWKDSPGAPQYIPPNTFGGVFVGDNQRAILDEMPT
jgi:hypothetical protein